MSLVIARRKGNKVRVFDEERAKMGPWQSIPQPDESWLRGATKTAMTWTIPTIRDHAAWLGLRIPSKMRKAELVDIVVVRTYFRQFTPGTTYYGGL